MWFFLFIHKTILSEFRSGVQFCGFTFKILITTARKLLIRTNVKYILNNRLKWKKNPKQYLLKKEKKLDKSLQKVSKVSKETFIAFKN